MKMKSCSTRMSSDKESDASRSQRQAVGGAPQARSGVERVNQRRNPGVSMVDRSGSETSCSDETYPVHHKDCNKCGISVADSLLEWTLE